MAVAELRPKVKRYYPTPAEGKTLPVVYVDLHGENISQDIIDFLYYSRAVRGGAKDIIFRDPGDAFLSENRIDEILEIIAAHRHSEHYRLPGDQAMEGLFAALEVLGEQFPHKVNAMVNRLCELFHAYEAEELFSLIAKLQYCPKSFLPTLRKYATSSADKMCRKAQVALTQLDEDGIEVMKLGSQEEHPKIFPAALFKLAKDEPDFVTKFAWVLPFVARYAGWDGYCQGCSREYQILVAEFGTTAWPELFKWLLSTEDRQTTGGIPYALAVIGHFEELVPAYATNSRSKIAILKGIEIAALPAARNFQKTCETCRRHKRLEEITFVFAWASTMMRDEDEKVRLAASHTLKALFSHPHAGESQLALVAELEQMPDMADPVEQTKLMHIACGLSVHLDEQTQGHVRRIIAGILHSLILRYRIMWVVTHWDDGENRKPDGITNDYQDHLRPQDLPEKVAIIEGLVKDGKCNLWQRRLLATLLATLSASRERERQAMIAATGTAELSNLTS